MYDQQGLRGWSRSRASVHIIVGLAAAFAMVGCVLPPRPTLAAAGIRQHPGGGVVVPQSGGAGQGESGLSFRWDLKPTGIDTDLPGLAAVSRMVVWASGSGGTVLRTVDGGKSWQNVSPIGAADQQFWDIEAFDSNNAVILAKGPDARIYRTQDGGASWTLTFQNTDKHAAYDAISFSDRDHGLGLSDPVGGKFRIISTSDGGRTWQIVPTAGMPPALPHEFGFAFGGTELVTLGNNAWFGTGIGREARVFHSADGGITWSAATTPIRTDNNSGIFSLAFRDSSTGLAVGGDLSALGAAVDAAALTSDGGTSWTLAGNPAPAGWRSGSAWVPSLRQTAIAVGTTGSDVSTDGGQTWRSFDTGSFYHVDCGRDGSCWASGAHGMVARLLVSQI